MKKILILALVMVLLFVSVSPALAGHGKGSGGRGSGRAGHVALEGGRGRSAYGNGGGVQTGNVITGIVTAINAGTSSIVVLVYGGKDTSLYGLEVPVQTDGSTRFVLKDYGAITFADIEVGDPVSVAIGVDGIADRVTVGADCPKLP